jgi:hypothetical protein
MRIAKPCVRRNFHIARDAGRILAHGSRRIRAPWIEKNPAENCSHVKREVDLSGSSRPSTQSGSGGFRELGWECVRVDLAAHSRSTAPADRLLTL